MRIRTGFFTVLLLVVLATACAAQEAQQPEMIVEKMGFKLIRGVANVTTCIVEIPKQSYLTVRDRGAVGYLVGPIKGVGMAAYRLFAGLTETVFFAVPQPGYYDPIIEPEYVWKGWEEKRVEPRYPREADAAKGGE